MKMSVCMCVYNDVFISCNKCPILVSDSDCEGNCGVVCVCVYVRMHSRGGDRVQGNSLYFSLHLL